MGLGLGDILGSISPAFGLASGKGLGSFLKFLSPAYDIFSLLGGGGSKDAQQPSAAPQLPASPQHGASHSSDILSMLNQSMMSAPKNNGQSQMPQAYGQQPQQMDDSMIQQLLGAIGQQRYGQGRFM